MSKTGLLWVVVAVVIIGAGAFWFAHKPATAPIAPTETATTTVTSTGGDQAAPSPESVPQDSTQGSTASTYTAAQVATHKDATSCWSIIDGKVYDLTKWIPQHPGGERAILGLCGKDGSAAFHGQHDDAKRQADILATMKIGTLAQ